VNRYRLLSQSQITTLHFVSKNTAQVRLQRLWQHGFLRRLFAGWFLVSEPFYTLDTKGIQLLQSIKGLPKSQIRIYRGKTINPLTIDHTSALTDLRISVEQSAIKGGLNLTRWIDDIEAKTDFDRVQIGQRLIPILPDAYIEVKDQKQSYSFFLEYDNGTEPLKTIERKMRAYQLYLQTGKAEARYGTAKIRVLFMSKPNQKQRLQHFHELAQSLTYSAYFWFSDTESVKDNFFTANVWQSSKSTLPQNLINSP
jgi:hypothetical protein